MHGKFLEPFVWIRILEGILDVPFLQKQIFHITEMSINR